MANYGLQVFKPSDGSLMWDSRTVVGGVLADVLNYAGTASGTTTYPGHAGRSVKIVPLNLSLTDNGVTADTSLGYPRVTVTSTGGAARHFIVEVY